MIRLAHPINAALLILALLAVTESDAQDSAQPDSAPPSLSQWLEGWGLTHGAGADDDPDGDGVPNSLEYFHGLDPTTRDGDGVALRQMAGDYAILDYRRSKSISGVQGVVRWSTNPSATSTWSSESIVEYPISRDPEFDWRRAVIPWPENATKIFIRIDISVSP